MAGTILPLSVEPVPGVTVRRKDASIIEWEQRQYGASEGIQVLMRVITDSHTGPKERTSALVKLGTVAPRLKETDHVPELIALYERLTEQHEKRAAIGCLAKSDDRRGLPLFTKVLSDTTDEIARFQAAYALARWNIRQGVRGLIGLLESPKVRSEGQRFADEILKVLQFLNRQKGWGRPDQEILQRISESGTDLTQEQKLASYLAEIKKWWAENEHRFPDWKPGDPLPETPKSEKVEHQEE